MRELLFLSIGNAKKREIPRGAVLGSRLSEEGEVRGWFECQLGREHHMERSPAARCRPISEVTAVCFHDCAHDGQT